MKKFSAIAATVIFALSLSLASSCDSDDYPGDPPTNPKVESYLHIWALLSWQGDADSYQVEIGGHTLEPDPGVSSVAVTGLKPSTTYTWRVRGVYEKGYSDWTVGPEFTTLSDKAPGTDPRNLAVSDVTWYSATLSWQGEAGKYEVSTNDMRYEVTGNELSLHKLEHSTNFQWRVRAVYGTDDFGEWERGEDYNTSAPPAPSINVTFGDAPWSSKTGEAVKVTTGKDSSFIVEFMQGIDNENGMIFPYVLLSCDPKIGATTDYEGEDARHFFDYYDENYTDDPITVDEEPAGNWWAKSGEVDITDIIDIEDLDENGKYLSGTAEMTVANARQILDGEATPEERVVSVRFSNIPWQEIDMTRTATARNPRLTGLYRSYSPAYRIYGK